MVALAASGPLELWRVAELFTGKGENFRELRGANQLDDERAEPGQEVLIPRSLLRPALPRGAAGARAGSTPLAYADATTTASTPSTGCERGEALYSSVVVRFTGRIFAEDVNALAEEIAAAQRRSPTSPTSRSATRCRSRSSSCRPSSCPPATRARQEYERELAAERALRQPGAVVEPRGHHRHPRRRPRRPRRRRLIEGVWESLYVYDIVLRVRRLLGADRGATVVTTRDGEDWTMVDRDVLRASRGHAVLTTPPYAIADARSGATCAGTWRTASTAGGRRRRRSRRVVFVSIHADSLHPSVRGAMVYVPGRSAIPATTARPAPSTPRAGRCRSSRASTSRTPSARAARASRATSPTTLSTPCAAAASRSIRSSRCATASSAASGPGCRRCCATTRCPPRCCSRSATSPTATDRRLIQTRAFREEVARSVVEGLLAYYGVEAAPARPPGRQQSRRLNRLTRVPPSRRAPRRPGVLALRARPGNKTAGCLCLIHIDSHPSPSMSASQVLTPPLPASRDYDLADRHRYGRRDRLPRALRPLLAHGLQPVPAPLG